MQEFQFSAVYLIANFFLYMATLTAIWINCENRFSQWLTILLNILAYPANTLLILFLPLLSFTRLIVGWTFIILVVQVLYRDKWFYKLIVSFAAILAALLSEAVFGAMMPRNESLSGELMQNYAIPVYAALLFVHIVAQTINVSFVRLLTRRSFLFPGRIQGALFLIFPISQFASVWLYFSSYRDAETDFHPWSVLSVVVIYLIADIALYFALRISGKNAMIQARSKLLEEEISYQKEYHAQLSSSYEQIRKLRHDIDNHLYTMQTMLESGHAEEAAQYAREVADRESDAPLFTSCKNTVVASFLEKKKEDFEASGLITDWEIYLPRETGISNPDLICAFGNILNNAQEACEDAADSKVEMHVNYQEPYLSILCENPVSTAEGKHKTKIPGMERGLGLLILEDLAKQYDGELQTQTGDNTFRTQLVLKGGSQNAEHRDM